MKVVSVVGARPNFVKAAVLSRALRVRHQELLLHTGQHYDDLMSEVFFRDLGLPHADINLGIGSGSHAVQTARALEGIEAVLLEQKPDVVLVYGDTNSTLAGALAAAKLGLPVGHVEAGFRSYERDLPEEINRVLTDHVSAYLFCATARAVECLAREGIVGGVHHAGDLMYDSLLACLPLAAAVEQEALAAHRVRPGEYFLATVHRAANTDEPRRLAALLSAFAALPAPVLLPLHPRTALAMREGGMEPAANVRVCEPVAYLEMLALERNARCILSDSGGVRREAYFLSVPCVTLREESEWPETAEDGWDVLAGADPDKIIEAALRPRPLTPPRPLFGDGRAAAKIVEILERDPPNG